jgi:hypothetical protein
VAGVSASWIAGFLCNLSFAFHAAAALIYGAWRLRERPSLLRGLAVAVGVTLIALLPWEVGFYQRKVEASYLLKLGTVPEEARLRGAMTAPTLAVPYSAYAFSVGFSLGPSLAELHALSAREALRRHAAPVAAAVLCFGAIGIAGIARWLRMGRRRVFWLLCLLVPVLAAYALALRNVKVFNPRYASAALPAFAMLLAEGVGALRPRWLAGALACGALALSAASLIQLQTRSAYWKEDARGATRILRSEMHPGDLIFVVGTPDAFSRYYWTSLRGSPVFRRFVADRETNPDDPAQRQRACDAISSAARTYVVFYRDAYDDPDGKWASFLQSRYRIDERWDPVGIRIWRLAPGGAS